MAAPSELATLPFGSADDWERWLDEHHAASPGIWLEIAKKGSETPTVTYAEAVEGALCFGWIDGQKRPLDESFWLQKFTPRGPRSAWSRVNRDRVAALLEAGRMRPAGLAEVERARADGRWEAAYEPQSTATVPDDLQRALTATRSSIASRTQSDPRRGRSGSRTSWPCSLAARRCTRRDERSPPGPGRCRRRRGRR